MTPSPSKHDVCASHREDLLDEALDESFPASDPIAFSAPVASEPEAATASKPTPE